MEDINLSFQNNLEIIIKKVKTWTVEMTKQIKKKFKKIFYLILLATCKKLNKMKYLYIAYNSKSRRLRKKNKRKIINLFYQNKNLFISEYDY